MPKTTQEKPEKKRFSGFIFKLAVAAAAVYLVVSFVGGQIRVADKQRELEEINQKLEAQVEENADLQRLMESDDEDAYVERVAREKLGYAKAKERVFVDLTGE
ncbi:septum formation initiator family protein [Ruminococcaceae bacterium OttesenSCG-928-D13]|nr:septum formation initiator family protein [Ruminococcaceae bacterium OttesenSCG-928-D13]